MSFPLVCICMAAPKPLVLLLNFLDHIKFIVCMFLFHCGINNISTEALTANIQNQINLALPQDHNTPSSIKTKLSVTKLRKFVHSPDDRGCSCVFCLEKLELDDEVRDLGNCRHVFHRQCLDRWIDVGKTICPTCRSEMLPTAARGEDDGTRKRGPLHKFLGRYW